MSNFRHSQEPTFSSFSRELDSSQLQESSFLHTQENIFNLAGSLSYGEQVSELTRIWMNERNSPEVLKYRRDLVESLLDAIETQSNKIFDTMDLNTDGQSRFVTVLLQTEIERIKYLIKNYLRTRLSKIEKFSLYLLRQIDVGEILSAQEYQEITELHAYNSFLHVLPASQHKQDEQSEEVNMVVEPNINAPVFAHILSNCGYIDAVG
ncbi:GINS complex subunit, partial [Rhizopus stolonifer]